MNPSVSVRQIVKADTGVEFTLLEPISEGSFGEVWRGTAKGHPEVAIKFLKLEAIRQWGSPQAERDAWTRFRREAEKMVVLIHRNIVRAYFHGSHRGIPFIIYEFCDGGTLSYHIASRSAPQFDERMRLFAEVCNGLSFAHSQRIVHRDLTPNNILIAQGLPKISDFGLAQWGDLATVAGEALTARLAALGTRGFAAPEQLTNPSAADERSDVFSLGLILASLVCWETITSDTLSEWNDLETRLRVSHLGITCNGIAGIVRHATRTNQGARYESVQRMKDDMDRFGLSWRTLVTYLGRGGVLLEENGYRESLADFVTAKCEACGGGPVIQIHFHRRSAQQPVECVACRLAAMG